MKDDSTQNQEVNNFEDQEKPEPIIAPETFPEAKPKDTPEDLSYPEPDIEIEKEPKLEPEEPHGLDEDLGGLKAVPATVHAATQDYSSQSGNDGGLGAIGSGGGPTDNGGNGSGRFSAVATPAGSKKLLLIGIGVVVAIGFYFIFEEIRSGTKVEKTPSEQIQERSKAEAERLIKGTTSVSPADEVQVTQAPKLPATPPIQAPQPPEPPPPPVPSAPQAPIFPQTTLPGQPTIPTPFVPDSSPVPEVFARQNDDERLKALEARRKVSIMVLGGGGADTSEDKGKDKDKDKAEKKDKDKSGFLGFGEGSLGEGTIARTKATQVKATQIGRLDSMIAEGKLIHAVLETAINTDLPGMLRAVITRDVYAESGKAVLIPKGSRVIGNYETQVKAGQTRVAVMWNRLIRPDGIDLALDSPGTDALGRSGIPGFLDDKFFTKLTNAFLISFFVPAFADKIFRVKGQNEPQQTIVSTNAATGITTTSKTTTFKQEQLQQSSQRFNEVLSKAIQDSFATTPTIYIDQGTQINIFVNKDLVFPADAALGTTKLIK